MAASVDCCMRAGSSVSEPGARRSARGRWAAAVALAVARASRAARLRLASARIARIAPPPTISVAIKAAATRSGPRLRRTNFRRR